jgi:hypothetical protein
MSNTEDSTICNDDWKKLYKAITEIPNVGEIRRVIFKKEWRRRG